MRNETFIVNISVTESLLMSAGIICTIVNLANLGLMFSACVHDEIKM